MYRQFKNSFSLILLDGDDFREKTSGYDSDQGTKILSIIKESILQELRDIDASARMQFDTFLILLPRTSRLQAKLIADRIRRNIHNKSKLNFSAGVVSARIGDNSDDLLERVKRALIRAKQEGKNCTVMI